LELINTKETRRVIGVDNDHIIPLIFYQNEVGFRQSTAPVNVDIFKNNQLKGLLTPHIPLQTSSGEMISLRQLANHILEQRLQEKKPKPTEFFLLLTFDKNNSNPNVNKLKLIEEYRDFDIITILLTSDLNLAKDKYAYYASSRDLQKALYSPESEDVIVIRPDSMLLGTLRST